MSDSIPSQEPLTQIEKGDQKIEQEPREEVKQNVLFGTIGYQDDESYENFVEKMNLSQAIFVLVASANFAQAKGSFNVLEAELLAKAIRVVRKNSSPAQNDENNNVKE